MAESSSSLLPDLLTKLYALSKAKEALWIRVDDSTFRATFPSGTVEICGTSTPYGLRTAIEQTWVGRTGGFLWNWISIPIKPVLLLASISSQSTYKWPDRKLRIVTSTGQGNEFLIDYESPLYGQVSQLYLVAELAIETNDLAQAIKNINADIDTAISVSLPKSEPDALLAPASLPAPDTTTDEHMAECPKCVGQTADQKADGSWVCENNCDLSGYQQCPRCGRLYCGTAPYCSDYCEDGELP